MRKIKDDKLRYKSRVLKAQGISYGEQAELIEVKTQAFYNWLAGQYEYAKDTAQHLDEIIDILWDSSKGDFDD